jgi:hypothetical protein
MLAFFSFASLMKNSSTVFCSWIPWTPGKKPFCSGNIHSLWLVTMTRGHRNGKLFIEFGKKEYGPQVSLVVSGSFLVDRGGVSRFPTRENFKAQN